MSVAWLAPCFRMPVLGMAVMVLAVFQVGCGRGKWRVVESGASVSLFSGDRKLVFHSMGAVDDTFHVLGMTKGKAGLERENGVAVHLWGISSELKSGEAAFTQSDLAQAEHLNLIPANDAIRTQLLNECTKKVCWKKLKLRGDRVVRVSEDGDPSPLDVGFTFVREVHGTR